MNEYFSTIADNLAKDFPNNTPVQTEPTTNQPKFVLSATQAESGEIYKRVIRCNSTCVRWNLPQDSQGGNQAPVYYHHAMH